MSEQHRPDAPSAPGEPASVRVRLDLAYDGGTFHGWARQPGLDSVQGALEDGLERILRRPVRTVVAGRTDAGVHARGQVVHLDLTETEWAGLTRGRPGLEPATSLTRRLGGVLSGWGGAVVVHGAGRAPAGFDARFSALWREYEYRIDDAPAARDPRTRGFTHWHGAALDDRLMALEADAVLGLHDFLSFCRPRVAPRPSARSSTWRCDAMRTASCASGSGPTRSATTWSGRSSGRYCRWGRGPASPAGSRTGWRGRPATPRCASPRPGG